MYMKEWTTILVILLAGLAARAQLQLSALHSDNMVLQSSQPIQIKGSAAPGAVVLISLHGKQYKGLADVRGKWTVSIPAQQPGLLGNLLIQSGNQTKTIRNVAAGEVWICSGQSNMEFTMNSFSDVYSREIKNTINDRIRFAVVQRTIHNEEQQEPLLSRSWSAIDSSSIRHCSAVAYFFAAALQRKLNVPVGLIITAWGGTPAQAWMDTASLSSFANYFRRYKEKIFPLDFNNLSVRQQESKKLFRQQQEMMAQSFKKMCAVEYDANGWEQTTLPGNWEEKGHPGLDGIAAYRITIDVPAGYEQQSATLHLPAIDDIDSTYLNGVYVGSHHVWNEKRIYKIAPGILKAGKNLLAIWVEDGQGGGGLANDTAHFFLQLGNRKISLAGPAAFSILLPAAELLPGINYARMQSEPGVLFSGMIAPLLSYRMKGVIWYQGESNAAQYEEYRHLFPALIKGWRKRWGQGDFPFVFAQLSAYNPAPEEPPLSTWAFLREAQTHALRLPNTAMAVTIDVGDRYDIHPKRKKEVGERLAANALHKVYGRKEAVATGPVLQSAKVKGNSIIVQFKPDRSSLMYKGDKLFGFTVAGKDKRFHTALAQIRGQEVVVYSPGVKSPLYVRYAWADAPLEANLYNAAGFPAAPFRTDR